jgi:tRNA A-37 threonylcarbamoyl transferase component Bud32
VATPETPTFRLVSRTASPGLLELPWQEPLEEWTHDRLVEVARGIHRHVVRFVELGGSYFALKELPARLAWREYRLLTELEHEEMPVVTPIGVVADRHAPDGEELEAVLITRYLEFSLPYRLVLARRIRPAPRDSLLDALVQTLVRLHLVGFFWGDCSLSNLLFRRDAGALSAYLVDAETGELHERLSDGQRGHDLDIAEENVIGELYDVAAELGHEVDDPFELGAEIRKRYEGLWAELTDEEVFSADESFRVEDRLRRLNELGFDAEEVEVVRTPEGYRLRLHSRVVEPGHHRRRLLHLTGLQAQENQARRLLNDITTYGKWLERRGEKPVSEAALAGRWLSEVFEPAVMSIPPELHGKLEAAELFHELLEHRWFLSEQAGKDVGMEAATQSYVDDVLRAAPEEKAALLADDYPARVENTDDGA